jgi:hypothetical protein
LKTGNNETEVVEKSELLHGQKEKKVLWDEYAI